MRLKKKKMNLSEREVFSLAFNRNVADNLLKPAQIEAAKESWLRDYFGAAFIADIEASEDDYTDFIEEHLKHIWAWGVLHNNLAHISMNITDKGIIQMLIEGAANVLDDRKILDAKSEIRTTVHMMLKRAARHCQAQVDAKNSLYNNYKGLEIQPSIYVFTGNPRTNQIKY